MAYSKANAAPLRAHVSFEMQAQSSPQTAETELRDGADATTSDDLARDVYCVLGIPIDAIDMPTLLQAIEEAAARKTSFLVSTPNLNHVVISRLDPSFRETLLFSELCPADGMPIIWTARLMGLPIHRRVAGSDLFEALRARASTKPLKIFLFGGAEGVGERVGNILNGKPGGLNCVGTKFPGYGTIEEMSDPRMIEEINSSNADFLLVALGAEKGQLWLHHNHHRLQIPVRAHLGATINFAAGTTSRAPYVLQKLGFEWLWRIKEEPTLWRRYLNDGAALIGMLLSQVIPLAIWTQWERLRQTRNQNLVIETTHDREILTLHLCGAASATHVDQAAAILRKAVATKCSFKVDLSQTSTIDARFLGLLLMLRKVTLRQGTHVKFIGASARLRAICRLHGAGFLLDADQSAWRSRGIES